LANASETKPSSLVRQTPQPMADCPARDASARPSAGRRTFDTLLSALAGGAMRSRAYGVISAAVVAIAVTPFVGWMLPAAWFVVACGLVIGMRAWFERLTRAGRDIDSEINPFAVLTAAHYSLAALWLVGCYGGAAQTLGVTLFGVVMFQLVARSYANLKHLFAYLAPPIILIVGVQLFAAVLILQQSKPWTLLTLFAAPLVVFRAFTGVRNILMRARKEKDAALAQLSKSEARYRVLAERSPDVIIRYDLDGAVEYVSPAAAHYGYQPEKLIGRNVADLIDPSEAARNTEFLADLAAGRPLPQGADNVWRATAANGEVRAFEGATSVLSDEDGRVVGAMSVLRDVTARVALEDELRTRRAEAEAANEAKSQFLANMSHEVRTPLTGVVGFARLLAAIDGLPEEARAHVQRISTSAEALLAVVNDVLDFSKLEARQVELDAQAFDATSFLADVVDLVRPQAEAKGLSLELDVAAGLPARLVADSARVRQVLLNLLTNAVKFTAQGRIEVAARWASDMLTLEVADTGPGLAPEDARRLFQRFSQVDGSNARQHGGTGLGLAISKGLAEMMGGQIGLKTALGRGSVFWFTVRAPQALAGTDMAAEPGAPAAPIVADGSPLRVLVVDDVAVNRELVSAILSPFDVAISTAASGAEAVEAACAFRFDIILMDLQMPGMDGMAAARAIRTNAELNRATPIVALSANVLPTHVRVCLAAGMNDHVAKPIDPADLIGKIARWTSPEARPEAAAETA
jgi:PAS domain S-box-containing protein